MKKVRNTDSQRAIVSRADPHDGAHYEPDGDQIVKAVHQVTPNRLPDEGPTAEARFSDAQDTRVLDVKATPEQASVWEAAPEPETDT